jgi:hypothetical protein
VAETAIKNDATVSAGGFRIEIYPDELTVTADRSAVQPRKKSAMGIFFMALVGIFVAFYFLFVFLPAILNGGFTYLAIVALLIAPSLLWAYLRGSKNLHCTHDNLEVIQVSNGRVRNKWLFPKDAVKGICFAPVSYSKYGSICGLVFTAQGKKVKILYRLECPEAQTILKQLDRLGFDVVHDVGMPMMVEMALERRNSWLNG